MEQMDMQNLIWIGLVMAALITAVILFVEREKKLPRARKKENAGAATAVLRRFALNNDGRVLGPMELTRGDRTVRLDGVLVGSFGVLGVRSLGYNGQIYGNPKEAQWVWVSADKRETFDNPIEECALAGRLLREALMNAGVRAPECDVVYVFADPKVELGVPRNAGAMKPADLRVYLGKDKFHKDRGYDLDTLCAALKPFVVEK